MALKGKSIGFIGAGAMAEAIISGIIKAELIQANNIWISDTNRDRLKHLKKRFNLKTAESNSDLIDNVKIVVLSVKPFLFNEVLSENTARFTQGHLIVSVAAGLSTGYISSFINDKVPIVRVMPNTPSLVGEGASALSAGEYATEDHLALGVGIFKSIGKTFVVREQEMDAVTGLSGSGPAYMYLIIEALADAGVKAGLSRAIAVELAAQTMYGAAKMVLETAQHPAVLKDQVTTPGGTTITGLHTLENGKIRATIIDAVMAATQRSKELGTANK